MYKMKSHVSKEDKSLLFYEKYYSLTNPEIKITLKDTSSFNCKIIGFFHGNENESFILKWHFADINGFLGVNSNGNLDEWIILQKELKSVYFFEDNTLLEF